MVTGIEGPLLGLGGPRVLNPVQKQFDYGCKVEWHVNNVTQAMRMLRGRRDDVQKKVEAAERTQETGGSEVTVWLELVAEIDAKVTRIQERYRNRCLCLGCCGLNCWSSYRIGKRAVKTLAKVVRLFEAGKFDGVTVDSSNNVTVVEMPNTPKVVGMKSYLDTVLAHLDTGGSGIVGIWGMGGVGKTTLLLSVNNSFLPGGSEQRSTQFHHVIWAVVSSELNLEKLQRDIASNLRLTLREDVSMEKNAAIVRNFLKTKSFLLLLDDLWARVDLNRIGIPLPSAASGGSEQKHYVVFTTRNDGVCCEMEPHLTVKIECLGPEEAWQLFEDKVGKKAMESDHRIPDLAHMVANECKGLPLALVVIGRAMKPKRSYRDWKNALEKLQASRPSEISVKDEEMLTILKFSYDSLADDTIRECFLCCSLWPEDYPIDPDSLVECWMGLNLIDEPHQIDNTYNKGHSLISVLKEACLLETIVAGREVKLHDVIRDMSIWISSECDKKPNKWLVKAGVGLSRAADLAEQWERAEEVERASLMNNPLSELPPNLPSRSKLTTLMLQKNEKLNGIPPGFFLCMPSLTYLDLSYTNISSLPEDIDMLAGLQFLNLSGTQITALPQLLANLQKLKHLLLQGTTNLTHIPLDIVSKLQSLRILDLYDSWYAIWETEGGVVLDDLNPNLLKLLGITINSLPALQKISTSPLAALTRRLCIKTNSIQQSLNLTSSTFEVMQSLQELMILNSSVLGVMTLKNEGWSLENLEVLKLNSLYMLQGIECGREAAAAFFPGLRTLHIANCYKLKNISWVLQLPCLENLELEFCPGMDELIKGELSEEEKSRSFPRLRVLLLNIMNNLTSICSSSLPFPSLEIIDIALCDELKKLPISSEITKNKLREIRGSQDWWNGLDWDVRTKSSLSSYHIIRQN